jgi:CubicO group peptidase (beta-lactamase class C family)
MTTRHRQFAAVLCAAAIAGLVASAAGQSRTAVPEARVDKIFSRWTTSTPGCAVAASMEGKPVLSKAFGMADLERDVKNTPETIFEAGSVSKQFTAAAVLLLAREGKLSLDDPIRKYIPEVHDYGAPLTIRHMLNHTSGLRDWGSVESIAGWPRTTRVNTHAHVLEVIGRQRSLNFPSGTRYSYSNSGYNLSAMLVARVSGMSFADFSKKRLFEPLGMTRTSWRDDHTRIVRDRAIAYSDERDGFHIDMPFENVHGNGGLLTTVGDLLKWNENFVSPTVGDASFVAEQQVPGKFNDGRVHDYALGLRVGTYKGVRQVDHSGSTAGYGAHLARYPDQRVSVAVLCNVNTGGATQAARGVADIYLGDRLNPSSLSATHTLTETDASRIAGMYRHVNRGTVVVLVRDQNGVRVDRGQPLFATSATRFVTSGGDTWTFDGRGGVRMTDEFGTIDTYERVEPATPSVDQLKALAGTYSSGEAETTFTVAVEGNSLVLKQRPDRVIRLTPVYGDTFAGSVGGVIFRRDAAGRVTGFSVVQDRVWDLRFTRDAAGRTTSTQ